MATLFLEPPIATDPTRAQVIVRDASKFLNSQKKAFTLPWPASLLISNESQEKWVAYENILIASLQTGDHALAKECVNALTERFGKLNERVLILKGMYQEAVALGDNELKVVLKHYDDIILESPTMFGLRKRRVALLKSMGRTSEAVAALIEILDASPTDAEAWVELADTYQAQGAFDQSTFCLEEVLLVMPNAWNIHAKLGEVLYLYATRNGTADAKLLSESIRRFCRSIELNSQYLRGYYGLKQSTSRYLSLSTATDLTPRATAQKLNELATFQLTQIVRKSKAREKGWDGHDEAELIAAAALLSQDETKVVR